MKRVDKIFLGCAFALLVILFCASVYFECKHKETVNGYCSISVYSQDGELIASHDGEVSDFKTQLDGTVSFSIDGVDYIYYNCSVEHKKK